MSRGALLVVCVSALLRGSSAAQEKVPPPRAPNPSPAAKEERSPGAPPEGEGSEKVRKERRPEPGGGERRDGPPALDPEALRIESQIREIQLALLEEIVHVEERIALIRWKLESELGLPESRFPPGAPAQRVFAPGSRGLAPGPGPEGGPGIPRKQARKAVRNESAPEDTEEERRYRVLLEREREIVAQWKAGARGRKGSDEEDAGAERADLRAELEQVLREILDLRERARERQVERLRREIEEIQRVLKVREDEKERERLVKSRVRELLGR